MSWVTVRWAHVRNCINGAHDAVRGIYNADKQLDSETLSDIECDLEAALKTVRELMTDDRGIPVR